MEDKIKEAFNAIGNDLKTGFSSVVALAHLTKDEDMNQYIKAVEKCQTKAQH